MFILQSYLTCLTGQVNMFLLTSLSKSLMQQSQRPISISCLCLGQKPHLTPKGALALKMVKDLTNAERILVFRALKLKEQEASSSSDPSNEVSKKPPNWSDLNKLAMHQSLPFIGFGFLDNFIMIVAGEYIDLTLGMKLGISTMAAAALGNTLSDMMGIGSAWYVESWAEKLGATPPNLSSEQLEMTSSRVANNLGGALGVVFGCLLGMFPLLFIDTAQPAEESSQ